MHHGGSQLLGCDFKRASGTGRILKKEGDEQSVAKQCNRLLGFKFFCITEDVCNLLVAQVGRLDEVLHGLTFIQDYE